MNCSQPGSSVHGDFPGKNTGVCCHALLQGIFPTQGSNLGLPHCRQILYHLSHQGSPRILEWVAYSFSRGSSQPRNWIRVSCIAGGFFTSWATREAPMFLYVYVNVKMVPLFLWGIGTEKELGRWSTLILYLFGFTTYIMHILILFLGKRKDWWINFLKQSQNLKVGNTVKIAF